ncbi:uncharacterized protein [Nicotiana sylvestris]|uniref:uncharacterized protein n=1 Tax=Nicotiana sylvestris TaxID=4096 RepID=UPI00388CE126
MAVTDHTNEVTTAAATQTRRSVLRALSVKNKLGFINGEISVSKLIAAMYEEKQREFRPRNQLNIDSTTLNVNLGGNNFKTNYSTGIGNQVNYSAGTGNQDANNRPRPFCNYCKRQGHTKDKCYKLHGYPQVSIKDHNNNNNTRFNKGRNVIANAVTNVEEGEKLELQGESQGQNTGNIGESLASANMSSRASMNFAGMIACTSSIDFDNPSCKCFSAKADLWILDSGASHHMNFNETHLQNIISLPYPLLVKLPNGYKVKVIEVGNAPSLKRPLEIGKLVDGLYFLYSKCLKKGYKGIMDAQALPRCVVQTEETEALKDYSFVRMEAQCFVDHQMLFSLASRQVKESISGIQIAESDFRQFWPKKWVIFVVLGQHSDKVIGPLNRNYLLAFVAALLGWTAGQKAEVKEHCISEGSVQGQLNEEATWETEQDMRSRYLHLFTTSGYPFGTKGYKVLSLAIEKIHISRDDCFYESVFPFTLNSTISDIPSVFPIAPFIENPHNHINTHMSHNISDNTSNQEATNFSSLNTPPVAPSPVTSVHEPQVPVEQSQDMVSPQQSLAEPLGFRRSNREHKLPSHMNDYVYKIPNLKSNTNFSLHAMFFHNNHIISDALHPDSQHIIENICNDRESTSYEEAVVYPAWQNAMT